MAGAKVRWRQEDEHFEVLGYGELWFTDDRQLAGAAEVADAASLTELRNAIDRYRALMYDVEIGLSVYDVPQATLTDGEDLFSPREVALGLVHEHTFLELTLVVDRDVRFNRHEVAAILYPQLERHRAVIVEFSEEVLGPSNIARLTVEITPRGRTVGDAFAIGDDLYRLWVASTGGGLSPTTVADLLRAQRPELLVGQPETTWFEAKGREYRLSDPLEELELAKDVSALANRQEGGLLVVGLATTKRRAVDIVRKVTPKPVAVLRANRYIQALDRSIYPRLEDVTVETIETEPDHGVMFILVPPQPEALRPFLVFGAIREDRLLGNHFSLVRRRGDKTVDIQAAAVHGLIVAGRAALATATKHAAHNLPGEDDEVPSRDGSR